MVTIALLPSIYQRPSIAFVGAPVAAMANSASNNNPDLRVGFAPVCQISTTSFWQEEKCGDARNQKGLG